MIGGIFYVVKTLPFVYMLSGYFTPLGFTLYGITVIFKFIL